MRLWAFVSRSQTLQMTEHSHILDCERVAGAFASRRGILSLGVARIEEISASHIRTVRPSDAGQLLIEL